MSMTENGASTTTEFGEEQYKAFGTKVSGKTKTYVQYDYRHINGDLFSCVKPTLEGCRAARDQWLEEKAPQPPAPTEVQQ